MNNTLLNNELEQIDANCSASSFFIGSTEVILKNKGENKGEIIINDVNKGTYQMYWGSMGGTIEEFILGINSDYFTDKLLGSISMRVFDCKRTFAALRKFIRQDFDLPWYKHQEFQSNLRENLNVFQERCQKYNSEQYFVEYFNDYMFIYLNFYLINDRFEREIIEENFKTISEPWNFIEQKESETSKWLKSIHTKIKAKLKQPKKTNTKKK